MEAVIVRKNVFKVPIVLKSPGQGRKTVVTTSIQDRTSKEPFQVSKVTAVRPGNLVIPSLVQNANLRGVKRETVKTIRLKFLPETEANKGKEKAEEKGEEKASDMEPVRRLPRSSELIRLEKQASVSKENISSSTDSLNEGSQKKARLKIPKPSKLFSVKSRSEDKKKKEDSNNNSPKKSGDSLDRARARRSNARRQSSKDLDLTKNLPLSQKSDTKDCGKGSPIDSPARERTALKFRNQARQVSFDETQREKPRSSSIASNQTTESAAVKTRPRRNTERIMRDYRLSMVDVKAFKCLLDKVDLFDSDVRDVVLPLLKDASIPKDVSQDGPDGDQLSEKVIIDSERESLKEKLFLSRKELDSYISFCKKMEREKRQTMSEKEDLSTKVQWLEKRLSLVESENKALKIERGELLNQIYKLRCPSNVPAGERNRSSSKAGKDAIESQAEVEVSKQRLLYEADAFAQERTKMIKERQRLDEEVRKVQIRCVSLLAQLQHSENTVDELQKENEEMKAKLENSTAKMLNDQKLLQEKIKDVQEMMEEEGGDKGRERRMTQLLTHVKNTEDDKYKLNQETTNLLRRIDEVTRDNRLLTEEKLNLEYEVMSLRDSVTSDQKSKNECEVKLAEVDTKLHHVQAELRLSKETVANYEKERERMVTQIEEMNSKMIEMRRREVELESEKVSFQKFIEILSLEMEERLGEEIVSTDAEAKSLQEKADILGKQISAHLTPSRKIQENVQDLKEEVEELKQENKALKYAMSCRLEIQNMQVSQSCNCSSENELMKRELDEATALIDHLEDEVKRLHEDKQSLLMSFLNLQAASRSREPSRTGTDGSSGDDDSGEVSDTEDDGSEDMNAHDAESGITDEEDEVSDDHSQPSSESGRGHSSLRKTISLPPEALRKKSEASAKPITSEETIANLESKLEEMKKTKEMLEDERVSLLDTICKQDQQIAEFKEEIEHLEEELEEEANNSSMNQSDACSNCNKTANEMRQYISIIETLTEDKLSLEKSLSDIRRNKEQLLTDIETVTKDCNTARAELSSLKADAEEASKNYQREMENLLQNLENMEQENKTLDEHLQKVRQNNMDLLEDLKVVEQDKLGLVKSLQALTMEKGSGDGGAEDAETKPITVEEYIDGTSDNINSALYTSKRKARRSLSTGDEHFYSQDDGSVNALKKLQVEIIDLKKTLENSRKEKSNLRKAFERVETLLHMEQETNKELEKENMLANEEILCLQNELETFKGCRKTPMVRMDHTKILKEEKEPKDFGDPCIRHSSWSSLSAPTSEQETRPPRRKSSAPCQPSMSLISRSPSVSKAKTLCFQISFNGVTLLEKTDFGDN